ncbi:MAG: acyltransferase family protein [Oscillospiraceae bacterium]
MAEGNAVTANRSDCNTAPRNYQLDFLKLAFTAFVFYSHTWLFGDMTGLPVPPYLGAISVHFFFVVSGMLMTNSIVRSNADVTNAGESAMAFVLKKFKGISLQYWVSMFICLSASMSAIMMISANRIKDFIRILCRIFPEAFLMTNTGVLIEYNSPTWYLSAMFIVMLPLAYMLYRHRDAFLNVIAPLTAVILLGYWCLSNEFDFADNRMSLYGIFIGGLIRALFGLCFGVVAWKIQNKLRNVVRKTSQRVLVTIVEIAIWLIFFAAWFVLKDKKAIYSALFILPVAVAIVFSRTGYVCRLFEFRWMKCFSSVSLAIYLNHWAARILVTSFFADCGYTKGVLLMAALTLGCCLIYYLLIFFIRMLWNKKLKKYFSNQEEQ